MRPKKPLVKSFRARDALGRGPQGSVTLAVVDVAYRPAHLAVSSAHTVGHFHLRHVQEHRASSLRLHGHGILDEGRVGQVGGWEPEANGRTLGLLLVGAAGLHLALPFHQLLVFTIIVLAEGSHDSLYEMGQLSLADARRAYEMPHLAAKFVEFVVGVHELHARQVCRKCRNSHRNQRFAHVS